MDNKNILNKSNVKKWISAYENLMTIKKVYWFLFVIGFLFLVSIFILIGVIFGFGIPSKYSIESFDKYMLMRNEGIAWYLIISFSFISIILYLVHLIVSVNLIYIITVKKIDFNDKNIKFTYGIFSFFAILVPMVFSIYFFWIIYDGHLRDLKNKKSKLQKRSWLSFFCLTPFLSTGVAVAASLYKNVPSVYVDRNAIKNSMTYSTNNKNVLFLYYENASSSLWNQLLDVDHSINKEKSFKTLHPEFTSFYNTITTGESKLFSNLTLNGGLYYSPQLLDENQVNPVSFPWKYYNQFHQNTYMSEIYFNLIEEIYGAKNVNFNDISFLNVPYWGEVNNGLFGDYNKMNKDLSEKFSSKNINATSTSAASVLKSHGKDYSNNNLDSVKYLELLVEKNNDGTPKNIKFEDTNNSDSTVKYIYNNHTTSLYSFYENGNYYRTNEKFENYIKSLWYSIQNLKELLSILKSVNHKSGGTVYDNTLIIVTSDKGYTLPTSFKKSYSLFWEYWKKSLNKDTIDYNQYKNMENFMINWGFINPVMMIKTFDSNIKSSLTPDLEFINSKNLISTSDIPIIIDAELQKLINNKVPTSSFYVPSSIPAWYDLPENLYPNISKNCVVDPLNNLEKLNERKFDIYFGDNWSPLEKTFDIWAKGFVDFSITKNIYTSNIEFTRKR